MIISSSSNSHVVPQCGQVAIIIFIPFFIFYKYYTKNFIKNQKDTMSSIVGEPTSSYFKIGFFALPQISMPCSYPSHIDTYGDDPKHFCSMSACSTPKNELGAFFFPSLLQPSMGTSVNVSDLNWCKRMDLNHWPSRCLNNVNQRFATTFSSS